MVTSLRSIAAFPAGGQTQVAYWIERAAWGKGIATRALALLLELVTARPLHARAASDNAGSLRVLQKCGFQPAGTEKSFAAGRNEGSPRTKLLKPVPAVAVGVRSGDRLSGPVPCLVDVAPSHGQQCRHRSYIGRFNSSRSADSAHSSSRRPAALQSPTRNSSSHRCRRCSAYDSASPRSSACCSSRARARRAALATPHGALGRDTLRGVDEVDRLRREGSDARAQIIDRESAQRGRPGQRVKQVPLDSRAHAACGRQRLARPATTPGTRPPSAEQRAGRWVGRWQAQGAAHPVPRRRPHPQSRRAPRDAPAVPTGSPPRPPGGDGMPAPWIRRGPGRRRRTRRRRWPVLRRPRAFRE